MKMRRYETRRGSASFFRAVRSELLRLRRSFLVPLHVALSSVLGLAAGLYFAATPWDPLLGYDAFVQLLGAGAPLLAGIACGLALDAEREAGAYANLLGQPSRRRAFAAKGVTLLALGAFSCAIAIAAFSVAMAAADRALPAVSALALSWAGAVAGSVVSYALFLAAALAWGRNAAIGLGAFGFMCALASLGGLGNGLVTGTLSASLAPLWVMAVPFVWPARLASLTAETFIAQGAYAAPLLANAQICSVICLIGTAAVVAVLLAASDRFETARRTGGE